MRIELAEMKHIEPILDMGVSFFAASQYSNLGEYSRGKAGVTLVTAMEKGSLFVALDGDELLGFMMLTVQPAPFVVDNVLLGYEVLLWVDRAHRKTGVAKKMLDFGGEWAKNNGAEVFVVSTPAKAGFEGAKKLFEELGFKPFEMAFEKRL